ncbi:CopG family transcriptional regulator [Pseudoduganella sp. FT55W]|uniref:CopG family transcriptional regulator n=1 Tax=Duganella rivi TaxID=2666083 RepID=A0A7X4GM39_9BURK|nr:CopG family transcriptional regulator [Duganella rivi]MYM65997.1 CopG family transcriptional regulator [Duganella rivi]
MALTLAEIEESIKSLSLTDKQRILDALSRELAEARHAMTLEALEDVDAGRFVDQQDVKRWADSLGTSKPLPRP